jgi:RND family efflux transporter MFP subunit
MTTEKQIQQLVIDRSSQKTSSKTSLLIMVVSLLVMLSVALLWLNPFANATSNSVGNNKNIVKTHLASSSKKASQQDNKHANEQRLKVVQATSKEIITQQNSLQKSSVLDVSGHVVARRIATVSSRVTGKLEKLNIEEGIEVKQYQVLAELEDKQAQISYQLALAELAAQQASYQETLILHKFALHKSERRKQLVKEKLISTELGEESQLKVEQIRAQLKNRQALVELAQQRTELALYQLEQHKIRAPFDGVVIRKNAQVGELISAGGNGGGTIRTGVGTIVDMKSLEIEVEVGESYINRVFAGQSVISTLDAYPQWKINSEVIAIIPTADRQKASIKVRVKLLEVDHRVLPDMGVKVSFLDKTVLAAL